MSEQDAKKLFQKENVNLVQYTNRSGLPRRDKEAGGELESLHGKIDPREFGSRAAKSKAPAKEKKMDKQDEENNKKKKDDTKAKKAFAHKSILSAADEFEGLRYRPKTKETEALYELILNFSLRKLGDQSQDILRSATDNVLTILKTDIVRDSDKKKEIEENIGNITDEEFNNLVSIGKKINDFDTDSFESKDLNEDEVGVAVVFENEEEESDEMKNSTDEEDEFEGLNNKEIKEETPDNLSENDEHIVSGKVKKETSHVEINPRDIDAFWLQRMISSTYSDIHMAQAKTEAAFDLLNSETNIRDCENELMSLFDYDKFELVKTLTKNRDLIIWCTKLARASSDKKDLASIEEEMIKKGHSDLLKLIKGEQEIKRENIATTPNNKMDIENPVENDTGLSPKQVIDLDALAFAQGSHLMSNKHVNMPPGSYRKTNNGYEEIHVPAPKPQVMESNEKLIKLETLPSWAQKAFPGAKTLNRIQSKVYKEAFSSDENILMCAPTGAGKTNVAMLCMLREISKNLLEDNTVNLEAFKMVYIAPMKALVQEMVRNFSSRLQYLGVTVNELTGDHQLTKQQIAETNLIVTTPEKWDVITRKGSDRSYTNLVRLIIIDEIHLLHDDRGPVLESIVSRTIRQIEQTQEMVRLVGLSATLPNYIDVAAFMRVDSKKGLFFFDNSYRPCPLTQQYIGITEKKAIKRLQIMNEVAYDKVIEQAGRNQVLIFAHSRKETVRTAKIIRDMALEKETIGMFLSAESASREILQTESSTCKNPDLQDLLPYGFAIHHAGMTRSDRTLVEELFAEGHIQVLCSTSTLAWGVNLPAHTVIIKGTQIYSPEKGSWTELSPQDVLQMLGRAGRPQFDTFGEGIIITTNSEIKYYLSLLNQQLPIESQLVSKLVDNLNAEIVLGNIRDRHEAVRWLGYTYLYVRMLRNSTLYGVGITDLEQDPYLKQKRLDLIHSAALQLDACQLIQYNRKTGEFKSTELGRIASHYYINHKSISVYNQHLKPTMGYIELFRLFSLSNEFSYLPIRQEEKIELAKLIEKVPVPIKEGVEEPSTKINVLLQAYISQLKLEGFALISDMVYVTQSAVRILRAIFEICLRRGWATLSKTTLDLCKIVEKRSWLSMSPLRQFKAMPLDLIIKIEKKDFPWERFYDLNVLELGELIGIPKAGKLVHKYVHQFPKLELQAVVQPITASLIRIGLTITPDFQWDEKVHNGSEAFWIIIEDGDGEKILHTDMFILKQRYINEDHYMSFTVPVTEPRPPNYFISVISDRWLLSETTLPISFQHLILNEKFPPHTELYDLEPRPVTDLKNKKIIKMFDFKYFNPIQTQTFQALYETDENVFIGAPTGSGKTVCAELALFRFWNNKNGKVLYLNLKDSALEQFYDMWTEKFKSINKEVVLLTGELSTDLKLLETGDLILSSPRNWDSISRRWKSRQNVQNIGLIIADELHLIGGEDGPCYEIVLSRMRYIPTQTQKDIRIVALSSPVSNSRDISEWIGVDSNTYLFNFSPSDRIVPLDIRIQSFNINHFPSLMLAMIKPAYLCITQNIKNNAILFVPSRKMCISDALEFLTLLNASETPNVFSEVLTEEMLNIIDMIKDVDLKDLIKSGIGYYHEALIKQDQKIVTQLYKAKIIKILFVSRECCWSLPSTIKADIILLMGLQFFDGKEHRFVDYPVTDVLQMMGKATLPSEDDSGNAIVMIMLQNNKKMYYRKFIYEGIPIESHLEHELHDCFNAEIVAKTIESKQDCVDYLTWTFWYKRISKNPNYYHLQETSHRHVSDFLSDLVENTLNDLKETNCITINDLVDEDTQGGGAISALNLGMIAAYYNIHYSTIDLLAQSLTEKTKIRGLLEIVLSSTEFETIPIRHKEEKILKQIYNYCPIKYNKEVNFNKPNIKANILLQAHFSRIKLTLDLELDLKFILNKIVNILYAVVDIISSNSWLSPAIATMELTQMCVQAIWDKDSMLKQIPYFDANRMKVAKELGVETIFDIKDLEDEDRDKLLKDLSKFQISEIAKVVNAFPSIDFQYELLSKDDIHGNSQVEIKVTLEREDEESKPEKVYAPYYPKNKDEGWWIIIGDLKNNSLLGIKRFTFNDKIEFNVPFTAPSIKGDYNLKVYLVADSFLHIDQELDLDLSVLDPLSEQSESDSD